MAKAGILGEVVPEITHEIEAVEQEIREGRFQRGLSLVAGLSSILSGLEVTYEHYRGSYGQPIMYVPVVLSPAMLAAGVAGFVSRKAASKTLPRVSALLLAAGVVGFGYHVRGIQRKPGGWRIPIANIIMGPPLFAPLLLGISGHLGLIASFLRREKRGGARAHSSHSAVQLPSRAQRKQIHHKATHSWPQLVREGRFQRHLAAATAAWSFFSGVESLYSHYQNNFRYKSQWTPVVAAPLLVGAALGAVASRKAAHTLLPAASLAAVIAGSVGFYVHARGVARRPGGLKLPGYNLMYGPPVFAPLLFAACGSLGLLASLLRREK